MKIYDTSNNLLAIVMRNNDITQGKNFVTNNDNEFHSIKEKSLKDISILTKKGLSGTLQRFLYLLKGRWKLKFMIMI